jgi:hypothetical protein
MLRIRQPLELGVCLDIWLGRCGPWHFACAGCLLHLSGSVSRIRRAGTRVLAYGLAVRPWHLAYVGGALYPVALFLLPFFFRFVVLV